eukprot:tig00001073_g6817.t1
MAPRAFENEPVAAAAAAGDRHAPSSGKDRQASGEPLDWAALPEINFNYGTLRKAIPKECFVRNTWLSIAYMIRSYIFAAALLGGVWYLNSVFPRWAMYLVWPAYWVAQGTVFWGFFTVGHDCGHGSFSPSRMVNNICGHLTHAPLLVPYHSWRISHAHHHALTGNVDEDESWYPTLKSDYYSMSHIIYFVRFELIWLIVGWPLYLLGARGRNGDDRSHFDPRMQLFKEGDKPGVIFSSAAVFAMIGALVALGQRVGHLSVFLSYGPPYLVFCFWITAVTFLHHTEVTIPWYRKGTWEKLRGALSTIDRDYGALVNDISHNIGTHVAHHLFFTIPHYNLVEATKHLAPALGPWYHKSDRGIIASILKSWRECRYVPDEGNVVMFTSPEKEAAQEAAKTKAR